MKKSTAIFLALFTVCVSVSIVFKGTEYPCLVFADAAFIFAASALISVIRKR